MVSAGVVVIVIVAVVVVILVMAIAVYNRLVRVRNAVDNSWAHIDVQLNRRHDLVPNLVATVQGYATHEQSTLAAVTQARTAAASALEPAERAQAENALTGTLKSLFAVAEAYPDLKANQNFLQLQDQLADAENRIAYSRQAYNDAIMTYNNAIQTFPADIVAGLTGFKAREPFHMDEDDDGPVHVTFPS